MALSNNQYDVTQLAVANNNGFSAALFPQIKDAYVRKMQEIYGYDIDVSSASADGQFIMAEALVLNNIYRTLEGIADGLMPASATGKYLDILASLSGTFRRTETYSRVELYLANTGTVDATPDKLLFVDKSGNRWQWLNPVDINGAAQVTLPAKKGDNVTPVAITATCMVLGPVAAVGANTAFATQEDYNKVFAKAAQDRGGDIYATVNAGTIAVFQNKTATLGQAEESDAALRARRIRSFGKTGTTVTDALIASLCNINGVVDAWVYSATDTVQTMADGIVVPVHSAYVVVATQNGVDVPDAVIGEVIYSGMTPGIPTVAATGAKGGTAKSYEIPVTSLLSTTTRWKNAAYLTPRVTVTLNYLNGTTALTDDQVTAIKAAAVNYFNSIPIEGSADPRELALLIASADFRTLKYGLPTFSVAGIKAGSTDFTMPKPLPLARFGYDVNTGVTYDAASKTLTLGTGDWPVVNS